VLTTRGKYDTPVIWFGDAANVKSCVATGSPTLDRQNWSSTIWWTNCGLYIRVAEAQARCVWLGGALQAYMPAQLTPKAICDDL
jgi:hypothetical protein